MKLNELTGIKNYPKLPKSKEDTIGDDRKLYDKIRELLKEKGFKYISEGAYGITFKGKNSVLKVFKNDAAYEHYVSLLKIIPNEYKQFVPKLTSVRNYPKNPDIKFVKIELLKEINLPKIHFNQISKLFYQKEKFKNKEELFNLGFTKEEENFLNLFPIDFINFVVWLNQNKKDHYFDLTNKNIMARNNTPVVIDPFVD
jgi:hypothetical protein